MSEPRRRIVVMFGGQSAEHDVSRSSASHVLAAIDREKYRVETVGITRTGAWVRADPATPLPVTTDAPTRDGVSLDPTLLLSPGTEEMPVVFPVLHGPQGEDGTIQGLLDLMDVPYVGTGVLGSALCMDKIKSKEMFDSHSIPQGLWQGLHADDRTPDTDDLLVAELGLPLFVKPANMGSSVGVSKVTSAADLPEALELAASYDEWIVVEQAIVGREIECSVLGNRDPVVSVAGEILTGADWYDYADKYQDGADLVIPAPLTDDELAAMQGVAVDAYRALRCEGLARVDFFYEPEGRGWLVNEINTMPGFTSISMYPKMWAASGVSYAELIDRLVELAIERHSRRRAHRKTTL